MELTFVLTLEEGLRRPVAELWEDQLKLCPSLYLIPLEHETLNRIMCPQCGGHNWREPLQMALSRLTPPPPNGSLDWPFDGPAGDRLHSQCGRCGHEITVTFWFTR